MTPVVASVGTTHPWNIAGVGLDLRLAGDLGARCVTVVAAVSAQGSGEHALAAQSAAIVAAQLRALRAARPSAWRIGALPSAEVTRAVAESLAHTRAPVVCDPVLASSHSGALAAPETLDALRETLFPQCTIVTPNAREAGRLTGIDVHDTASMRVAARALAGMGARAALVTGGDIEGTTVVDVLCDGRGIEVYEAPRIAGGMRGTGCVLAFALALGLARGQSLLDALASARATVRAAIAASVTWDGERVYAARS